MVTADVVVARVENLVPTASVRLGRVLTVGQAEATVVLVVVVLVKRVKSWLRMLAGVATE